MSEMMPRELTYVVARNRELPAWLTSRLSSFSGRTHGSDTVAVRGWSTFPPQRSSYAGEGAFGSTHHGLLLTRTPLGRKARDAYDRLPSEAKGYFAAAGAWARMWLGLSGAGDVAETLLDEASGIHPRDAVETFIPFVEMVEVSSVAHRDERGDPAPAVIIVQEPPAGSRRTFTVAPLGREAPGLIMRARLDREIDYLRARARMDTVDLRAIQEPLLERAQSAYDSGLQQLIKEALGAVRDRVRSRWTTGHPGRRCARQRVPGITVSLAMGS